MPYHLSSNAIKLPVVWGTGVVLLEPAINKNMAYINMIAANAPLIVEVHYKIPLFCIKQFVIEMSAFFKYQILVHLLAKINILENVCISAKTYITSI